MIPKISVIVPMYNGEKYIDKCLDSINNQTLKNIEIIVVNDGSKDSTETILEEKKKIYKNLVVINQENKGPASARNVGISIAQGKYIGFVDADDRIDNEMYEKLYSYAEKYDADLVMCGQEIVDQYGNSKDVILPNSPKDVYYNKKEIKKDILEKIITEGEGLFASQGNKIYKKSIIDKFSIRIPENRTFAEDLFFNQMFLGKIERICFVEEALYKYVRINKNSLASIYRNNWFELCIDSRKFRKYILVDWGMNSNHYKKISNEQFCKSIYNRVILGEFSRENEISFFTKIKNISKYINSQDVIDAINNSYESKYTKILSKKKVIKLIIVAYFDAIIKPKLSYIKLELKKVGKSYVI